MNYYISDTHFGHKNIMKHDGRAFNSCDEMDEAIISRWNDVVKDNDSVYVLGDFSWYKEEKTIEILDRLKGNKALIQGNHDRVSPSVARKFFLRTPYAEIKDNGIRVILCHYPMLFYNGQFRDTVHLYGHIHASEQHNLCEEFKEVLREKQELKMRMYNVGAMLPYMNYTPRPLEYILEKGG